MARGLPGRFDLVTLTQGFRAKHVLKRFPRDRAGPKEVPPAAMTPLPSQGYDGRFKSGFRGPAINHRRASLPKRSDHVRGARRAHLLTAIGGRSGQREVEAIKQGLHHRVRRVAQRDCGKAGAHRFCQPCILAHGQHQRQRSRPEPLRHTARAFIEKGKSLRLIEVFHMNDQRVETWPAFGGIDSRHRLCAIGARGKAIDCFRRHADKPARLQNRRRSGESFIRGR